MLIDAKITVREVGDKATTYNIDHDLNGEVSLKRFLEFTKEALIKISLNALKEEQAKGFDKNPITVVDGNSRKNILDVSPLGKIEFISTKTSAYRILEEIYVDIFHKSKIVTGTYAEGNFVFLNGAVIATNLTELRNFLKANPTIKPKDIFRFVNVVPYARKLERYGITAQRTKEKWVKSKDKQKRSGSHIRGPNGVYFLTSRIARQKYKHNVGVFFGFILGSTLGVQNVPIVAKNGKTLRKNYVGSKNSSGKVVNTGPYLYPYIKVIIGESGVSDV